MSALKTQHHFPLVRKRAGAGNEKLYNDTMINEIPLCGGVSAGRGGFLTSRNDKQTYKHTNQQNKKGMKKTILLLTICLFAASISASAQTQKKDIPLWKWAIQPQFEEVGNFFEGLARAEQNGKWGFIDKTGKWIIQPKFDYRVGDFSEGLARAGQNDKYGYIDKTGEWVIQPQFDYGWSFSEGLALAYQNGKWGFIDKTGKWVIEPQFDNVGYFSESLACAKQNDKWGFIDKTGKWVIEPQFDYVGYFSESLACAKQNGKYGFIDKTGKWIIQSKFDGVGSFFEGLARAEQNGKEGFIDKTGKWIIQPQFDWIESFREGLARAKQNGKRGFIDKTGKWIILPQFDNVGIFSEGLARIKRNDKYGFISFVKNADDYIKLYISEDIKTWQQKDEFESIEAYKQRMATIEAQTKKLFNDAVAAYKTSPLFASATAKVEISAYDSENRTFLVSLPATGEQFVVKVEDAAEARRLKENWENTKIADANFINARNTQTGEEKIMMAGISLQNGNNVYASGQYQYEQIVFNSNIAEVDLRNIVPTGDIYTPKTTVRTENLTAQKSDVDIEIPETKIKNDKTFAVIIGVEDYDNTDNVPFARNDAHIFHQYAMKTLGIPKDNIKYLDNAGYGDITTALAWIKGLKELDNSAKVLFYFAGHIMCYENTKNSDEEPERYLLPKDALMGTERKLSYKLDEIYSHLGNLPVLSTTVFLDACYAGNGKGARGIAITNREDIVKGNLVVFTASDLKQTALPYAEKGHGLFTYFLLEKIKQTQGNVTYKDLFEYLKEKVEAQASRDIKEQTPKIIPSPALKEKWENMKLYEK
jgi:hypothetical protein